MTNIRIPEDFKDKVVVITGASSGIGRAIALEIASRGFLAMYLIGRHRETLNAVARKAGAGNDRIVCLKADLTDMRHIHAIAKRVENESGSVDVLIHSAGTISLGSVETASVEDLDSQFQTNVRAPFLLTKALLPMMKHKNGQIVFINSSAGLSAKRNVSQYSATKHALKALADSLREEINDFGVRVMSIYPGQTNTPMQAKIYKEEEKDFRPERLLQPEDVASVAVHALCMPRTAEVTDIRIRPMLKN